MQTVYFIAAWSSDYGQGMKSASSINSCRITLRLCPSRRSADEPRVCLSCRGSIITCVFNASHFLTVRPCSLGPGAHHKHRADQAASRTSTVICLPRTARAAWIFSDFEACSGSNIRRITRSCTPRRRANSELLTCWSRIARNNASFGANHSGTGTRRCPRFASEGAGISSLRVNRIERSDPRASMASSIASRSSLPSVATCGRSINSTRIRPSPPPMNLAGYASADISSTSL